MTYKVMALARLVCPRANIPSTTALATLNIRSGRELGLVRGANVIMPNLTPPRYRVHYEIYPDKACMRETAGACQSCIEARIRGLGRTTGSGRGDSPGSSVARPKCPHSSVSFPRMSSTHRSNGHETQRQRLRFHRRGAPCMPCSAQAVRSPVEAATT